MLGPSLCDSAIFFLKGPTFVFKSHFEISTHFEIRIMSLTLSNLRGTSLFGDAERTRAAKKRRASPADLCKALVNFFPKSLAECGEHIFILWFWTRVFAYCGRDAQDGMRLACRVGARIVRPLTRFVHVPADLKTVVRDHTPLDGCRTVFVLSDQLYRTGYQRRVYIHPNLPPTTHDVMLSAVDLRGLDLRDQVVGSRHGVSMQPYICVDEILRGLRVRMPGMWFAEFETNGRSPSRITIEQGVKVLLRKALYGVGMSYLELPDSLRKIGARLCARCQQLREIRIPPLVSVVPLCAFQHCVNLMRVTLPPNVHTLGPKCFNGCLSLKEFRAEGVERVQPLAFAFCTSLKTVCLPKAHTFGNYCFHKCSALARVRTGDVVCFATGCFANCTDLVCVSTPAGDNVFRSPFSRQPDGIGARVFASTKLASVTIDGLFSQIPEQTFWGCTSLRTVCIRSPFSVDILKQAFMGCKALREFDTGSTKLAFLGNGAFQGCKSLTEIRFSHAAQSLISSMAFAYCTSLRSVDLPDHLERVPEQMFYGCTQLSWVKIPASVEEIGEQAFYNCHSLEEVQFAEPSCLKMIDTAAFEECSSLEEMVLPRSLKYIQPRAFCWCERLLRVTFPDTLKMIGASAFAYCETLTEVSFAPVTLQFSAVGRRAFYKCVALQQVRLPLETKRLCAEAFAKCTNLKTVVAPWLSLTEDSDVFLGVPRVEKKNMK